MYVYIYIYYVCVCICISPLLKIRTRGFVVRRSAAIHEKAFQDEAGPNWDDMGCDEFIIIQLDMI